MHDSTKDIVYQAGGFVASGQMSADEARQWTKDQLKSISILSDIVLEALWKKYDTNKDGELSVEELELLVKDYLKNAQIYCKPQLKQALLDQFALAGSKILISLVFYCLLTIV